jgi:hypothetical protein
MQTGDLILIKTNRLAEPWRMGTVTAVEFDVIPAEHFIELDDRPGKIYESEVLGPIHYLRR